MLISILTYISGIVRPNEQVLPNLAAVLRNFILVLGRAPQTQPLLLRRRSSSLFGALVFSFVFLYASYLAAPVTLSQSCLILRLLIRLQFCISIHVPTCPRLARNLASGGTGRLSMTRAFMRHGRSFGAKCPPSGQDTDEFGRLYFKVDEIRKTEIALNTIS